MYRTLNTKAIASAAFILGAVLLLLGVNSASAASSLFGGATESSGHVVLVSDGSNVPTADDYSGVSFDDADGTVFSTLTNLAADYDVTDDSCGGGSPRFQIAVDTNGDTVSDGNVFVYMGPSPSFTGCSGTASTGNLIGNEDAGRWDYTQLGGPLGGYSGAPANVLSGTILGINIVVDSSWSAAASGGDNEQTVNIDNVMVNSNTYSFPEPSGTVTVTIDKYVQDTQATAISANSASFPMQTTYSADNIGSGTDVPFNIGPSGFNSPNPYEAITSEMTSGADYAVHEVTGGDVVGASCEDGKPFALSGYTWGDTLEAAQQAQPSMTSPSLTDITTDKYVIVWNRDCSIPLPTLTIVKHALGADGTFDFVLSGETSTSTSLTTSEGAATSSPITLGVGSTTISELALGEGWAANGASCVYDGESTGTETESGEEINADYGDEVTCTFTNTYSPLGQTELKVHIYKYVDNGTTTAQVADNSTLDPFPMESTWNSANLGAGTGTYVLGNNHGGASFRYAADTASMTSPADYTTHEITSNMASSSAILPANAACETGKYRVEGYKSGTSLSAAQAAPISTSTPTYVGITSDRYIIVVNEACSPVSDGEIGGDVVGDGVLAVTSIDSVDTSATADNSYENGWEYLFHITVPTDESNIAMKFSDWTSGANTIPAGNNMRISSAQADNGGATVSILAANTYTTPNLHMTTDLNPAMPGIQVEVKVEVKIPVGTPNASYTTSYGVKSE